MDWLWGLLLAPVGLVVAGFFVCCIGDEDVPFKGWKLHQLADYLGTLMVIGLVSTVALAIVFAPVLLMYNVFHLPYGVSALIGLPLGFALVVKLAFKATDETGL